MSAAHTPAPWFATKVSDYNEVARIGRAWNISTMLPLSDFGDIDADAHLIAAAPELLAALRGCVEVMERMYAIPNAPAPVLIAARDAIKKATEAELPHRVKSADRVMYGTGGDPIADDVDEGGAA